MEGIYQAQKGKSRQDKGEASWEAGHASTGRGCG